MKKIELVCKNCGNKDFYISLSERMNSIFELKDRIITKKDTSYPDNGEINYVKCSKCNTEVQNFDDDAIISLIQKYL